MVFGKDFHNTGPATENDLEANVCLLVCGPPRIYDLCQTLGPPDVCLIPVSYP